MSRRLWIVLGAAALVLAIGAGVVVWSGRDSSGGGQVDYATLPSGALRDALEAAQPAGDGFERFTVADLSIGGDCRRVVVADTQDERVQGLRAVRDLAPYDGMLFVLDAPVQARFTMADTLIPLDIGFYDSDGRPLRELHMVPCRTGNDATCPIYDPRVVFRFALETESGQLGSGALGGCG